MPGEDARSSRDPSLMPRPTPPPMAAVAGGPAPLPAGGPYAPVSHQIPPTYQLPGAGLQSPHVSFGTPPSQPPAGPPPHMFSPQAQPQNQMQPGFRKSHYVAPDFSSLPSSQSQGSAGPPPMGPAIAGGYRRGQQ